MMHGPRKPKKPKKATEAQETAKRDYAFGHGSYSRVVGRDGEKVEVAAAWGDRLRAR